MPLIELKLKIPEYAMEELNRLIKKYSNEALKGEYDFDIHSMITLMIMTYDKSGYKLINTDKIIKKIKEELKNYYKK
jgi:hypothetical protein